MDYWVAAPAPEGEVGLYELDVSRRLAIVAGAEVEGLRRPVKERRDFLVKSRWLSGSPRSNLAVAMGIVLFENRRHRTATATSKS
jgi:tRNA G18 (ribose-2'-O)-methylase SpoU